MIELRQLKSFCAVVENGSFTKAGEAVHRIQSTISAQIAMLEDAYGEPLLNRLPGKVVPTESGKVLYEYAQRVLALVDESQEKIGTLKNVIQGSLIIGASTIPGTYIIPQILKNFKERYPQVVVSLQISNSRQVIKRIQDYALEIGAVGRQTKDKRLEYVDLAKDKIVLVVPPRHKWARKKNITLSDLTKEPFISREQGSGTRATVESALKKKGIRKINIAMEVGSTEAVKQSVEAGLGVSLISEWAIRRCSLKKVTVKSLDIVRSFYVVFHKGTAGTRPVQAFADFIKKP